MKKYLFVINPVSGGTDKSELIKEIKNKTTKECDINIYQTSGKDDLKRVQQIVSEYQPDVMAVAGGDGTINEMSEVLFQTDILLAIIPSGSANGLATSLGINDENALQKVFGSTIQQLDVVSINNRRMLHLADLGINATLVKRYEDDDQRGFIGYAISALKEFPSLSQLFNVEISNKENETFHYQTNFLVIANARLYGTGFQINPIGKIGDQRVEICVLKEISSESILDKIFNREPNHNVLFNIHSSSGFSIRCDSDVSFQIDGEYIDRVNSLEVSVLPDQIKVLC